MTQATTGPITLHDVRAALADTDPTATNAGALQKIIGRGSNATVQKHLDTIRAERLPVPPVAPGTTPAAPADAVAVIWGAAWAAAQAQTLGRLEAVTVERERLSAVVEQQAQDLAAALASVDAATEAAAAISTAADQALADAQAEKTTAISAAAAAQEALQGTKAALELAKTEAAAAAALATRDAQIERQALQAMVDRLTDQASELKSLLARLTPANK